MGNNKNFKAFLILLFILTPGYSFAANAVISQSGWSLHYSDSEELVGEPGAAINAFDGNTATIWHTKWKGGSNPLPHEIQINLGASYNISGFRYSPRLSGGNGNIGEYAFYVSNDGSNWGTAVATGIFSDNQVEKEVAFSAKTGRYIRLQALTEAGNTGPWTSVAEINVLIPTLPAELISQADWSVNYADSEELVGEPGGAINAFDGNTATIWHTKWYGSRDPLPHEIQINLGASYNISSFRYSPRLSGGNGNIGEYAFYVSNDGSNWGAAVATGTFTDDQIEKEVTFSAKSGRYIRLQALSEAGDTGPWTSVAEINVLGNRATSTTAEQLAVFYKKYGGQNSFSPEYRDVVETMLLTEDDIFAGNISQARDRLAAIWNKYPVGNSGVWNRIRDTKNRGINVGSPTAYYALRMLQQIVDDADTVASATDVKELVFAVFLAGCSEGPIPQNTKELVDGTGAIHRRMLDSRLYANDYSVIRQSLNLWLQYVNAASDGKLKATLKIVELPNLCLKTKAVATPYQIISTDDYWRVFKVIDKDFRYDWSWVIYPSMLPKDFSGFTNKGFITGGMGRNPLGGPLMIGNDAWLLEKPPHLGRGLITEVERRTYLPQWVQHEHLHHFFQKFSEFKLEVKGHQWFDRSTWPADFVGVYEPDYYAEALNKRIKTANPRMHERLLYAPKLP